MCVWVLGSCDRVHVAFEGIVYTVVQLQMFVHM